jgi:hypothetical protein
MISDRPAEVEDRAVLGHWEGDLILGAGGRTAVDTLVERSTRFVLLLHLSGGRSADAVEVAMRDAIATLSRELMRSVTWDSQGDDKPSSDYRGDRRAHLLLRSTLTPINRPILSILLLATVRCCLLLVLTMLQRRGQLWYL